MCHRSRSWLVAGAAAAAVLACGDAGAPTEHPAASQAPDAARLLGPGGRATYVLAHAGATAEPVATFDHLCADGDGGAVVRRTHVVYDTLALQADGTAMRAFTLEYRTDGVADPARTAARVVAAGTWAPVAFPANWRYLGGKPGVSVTLTSSLQNGSRNSYTWHFVLDGAGRLTTPMALGGACVGPERAGDGRHEEAVYTRR